MKVYNGHSREFYLHIEKNEWPIAISNYSDSTVIFELIRDLDKHISPATKSDIAIWCLNKIKEAQERTPANVSWFEDALERINKIGEIDD